MGSEKESGCYLTKAVGFALVLLVLILAALVAVTVYFVGTRGDISCMCDYPGPPSEEEQWQQCQELAEEKVACGRSSYPDAGQGQDWTRQINGVIARPFEFPWMVALSYSDRAGLTTASILNEKYLIGAAHTVLLSPETMTAHVGTNRPWHGGQKYDFEEIIIHPNYSRENLVNDIALFRVKGNIKLSPTVRSICPPQADNLYVGAHVTDLGWGISEEGTRSEILRYTNMIGITNEECENFYANFTPFIVTDENYCFDSPFDRFPCYGDSGGPAVFNNNGVFELVGINSWASSCDFVVGVTTRVSAYLDWIEDNIRK